MLQPLKMAHPLLHLAALERLAREPEALPESLARPLVEEVEYGRFGVLLSDLPSFQAPLQELRAPLGLADRPPRGFTQLFHAPRPIAVLVKMAELVGRGALVKRSAGLALLAGHLTHIAFDRALDPSSRLLAERHALPGQDLQRVQRRFEWFQALLYLRERFGREPLGDAELVHWMRVVKRQGMPWAGVGGGIYEIVRLSLFEVYGRCPTKAAVDSWVRGLYAASRFLASPVGRRLASPRALELERQRVYLGPGVDFPAELERAFALARGYLARLSQLLERGDFGQRARGRFLSEVPDGQLAA
ncbi:MAG: hypothetical protein ACYCWW_12150 [Deltaproteobacteria bacterium]